MGKQYLYIYGAIGGAVLAILRILEIVTIEKVAASCLIVLLIPLVVGFFGGRKTVQSPGVGMGQGLIDGGMAAVLTGVTGGTIGGVISFFRDTETTTDFFSVILIGVVVLSIACFMMGLIGGAVGAALSGGSGGSA